MGRGQRFLSDRACLQVRGAEQRLRPCPPARQREPHGRRAPHAACQNPRPSHPGYRGRRGTATSPVDSSRGKTSARPLYRVAVWICTTLLRKLNETGSAPPKPDCKRFKTFSFIDPSDESETAVSGRRMMQAHGESLPNFHPDGGADVPPCQLVVRCWETVPGNVSASNFQPHRQVVPRGQRRTGAEPNLSHVFPSSSGRRMESQHHSGRSCSSLCRRTSVTALAKLVIQLWVSWLVVIPNFPSGAWASQARTESMEPARTGFDQDGTAPLHPLFLLFPLPTLDSFQRINPSSVEDTRLHISLDEIALSQRRPRPERMKTTSVLAVPMLFCC